MIEFRLKKLEADNNTCGSKSKNEFVILTKDLSSLFIN
jgi:hypothetical protein